MQSQIIIIDGNLLPLNSRGLSRRSKTCVWTAPCPLASHLLGGFSPSQHSCWMEHQNHAAFSELVGIRCFPLCVALALDVFFQMMFCIDSFSGWAVLFDVLCWLNFMSSMFFSKDFCSHTEVHNWTSNPWLTAESVDAVSSLNVAGLLVTLLIDCSQ